MKNKLIIIAFLIGSALFISFVYLFIPGKGDLTIETSPPGGKVYVDGKAENGTTPIVLKSLSTGNHEIRIKREAFEEVTQKIRIKKGGNKISTTLSPISEKLTLIWNYRYKVEKIIDNGQQKYQITLFAILNRTSKADVERFNSQLKEYKKEALGWLAINAREAKADQIEYIPSLAKDL